MIGLELIELLLVKGENVVAVSRFQSNDLMTLKIHYPDQLKLLVFEFSLENKLGNFFDENLWIKTEIDVFISMAAMRDEIPYANMEESDLVEHLYVNAVVPQIIIKELSPYMLKKMYGRILIVSSIGVKYGGGKNTYAYSMSKSASEFFPNESRQWVARNVTINVLRPGIVDTPKFRIGYHKNPDDADERINLIPAKRSAKYSEIVSSILWLTSKENSYMTGQIIAVSGGE